MRFHSHKPALAEVDMTPMIDIVFQLIAFFMVITNFEQTQADERVKLPRDQLARPTEVAPGNELVVNVGFQRDAAGEVMSGPLVFYASQEIPVLNSRRVFEREAELARVLDKDPADTTVVIRADADVPTGMAQELIRLAQEAGFHKFILKATQARE